MPNVIAKTIANLLSVSVNVVVQLSYGDFHSANECKGGFNNEV